MLDSPKRQKHDFLPNLSIKLSKLVKTYLKISQIRIFLKQKQQLYQNQDIPIFKVVPKSFDARCHLRKSHNAEAKTW